MKKQVVKPTADTEHLTVKYWRERFSEAFKRFDGLTELANVLGMQDEEFAGLSGFRRLENVKREKGSLLLTAKVVGLMNEIRPAPTKKVDLSSVLKRQRLVAPSTD